MGWDEIGGDAVTVDGDLSPQFAVGLRLMRHTRGTSVKRKQDHDHLVLSWREFTYDVT